MKSIFRRKNGQEGLAISNEQPFSSFVELSTACQEATSGKYYEIYGISHGLEEVGESGFVWAFAALASRVPGALELARDLLQKLWTGIEVDHKLVRTSVTQSEEGMLLLEACFTLDSLSAVRAYEVCTLMFSLAETLAQIEAAEANLSAMKAEDELLNYRLEVLGESLALVGPMRISEGLFEMALALRIEADACLNVHVVESRVGSGHPHCYFAHQIYAWNSDDKALRAIASKISKAEDVWTREVDRDAQRRAARADLSYT